MNLSLRFPHAYEAHTASTDDERNAPTIHFSGVTDIADKKPLRILVSPHRNEPWVGRFNRYSEAPNAVTGVFTYPNESSICVIAGGQAYIVDVEEPHEWEAVDAVPVIDVIDLPELKVIVFADYTNLTAYGSEGFLWRSERLSYDGIRLIGARAGMIEGVGWSAPRDEEVGFVVDAETGRHEGGAF